ncbi:hypothetical protein OG361_29340 [Streptomyces sp. NBC_00090]|uniref:hypothetical protein n=1 Tax=Streptomyces sp. NBC_00090 TaxID=2903619 RepID=UPI00324888F1
MGVFALFRRKKKEVVEASSEETGAVGPSEDDVTEAGAAETRAAVDAEVGGEAEGDVTAEADGDGDGDGDGTTGAEAAPEAVAVDGAEDVDTDKAAAGAVAAEVVEIPKQQSAEAAADNEAGEGARK